MRRKFLAPRSLQTSSQSLSEHAGKRGCVLLHDRNYVSTSFHHRERTTHKSLNLFEVLVEEHVREPAQPTHKVSLRPPRAPDRRNTHASRSPPLLYVRLMSLMPNQIEKIAFLLVHGANAGRFPTCACQ